MRNTIKVEDKVSFYPIILLGVGCGLIGSIFDNAAYIKLTPFLISSVFLCSFAYTLWRPPTIIEQIARLSHPEFPESAISYTNKVTVAWCLFFMINGSIALYTALFSSLEVWTLYNGLLSYLLMGVLFGTEYCIRLHIIKKYNFNG